MDYNQKTRTLVIHNDAQYESRQESEQVYYKAALEHVNVLRRDGVKAKLTMDLSKAVVETAVATTEFRKAL